MIKSGGSGGTFFFQTVKTSPSSQSYGHFTVADPPQRPLAGPASPGAIWGPKSLNWPSLGPEVEFFFFNKRWVWTKVFGGSEPFGNGLEPIRATYVDFGKMEENAVFGGFQTLWGPQKYHLEQEKNCENFPIFDPPGPGARESPPGGLAGPPDPSEAPKWLKSGHSGLENVLGRPNWGIPVGVFFKR